MLPAMCAHCYIPKHPPLACTGDIKPFRELKEQDSGLGLECDGPNWDGEDSDASWCDVRLVPIQDQQWPDHNHDQDHDRPDQDHDRPDQDQNRDIRRQS